MGKEIDDVRALGVCNATIRFTQEQYSVHNPVNNRWLQQTCSSIYSPEIK